MRVKAAILGAAIAAVLAFAVLASGQFFPRHRISPHETTSGSVDGASLSINYGRPSMRGRKIFGDLVPWDRVWCPGADECTKLTTDRPLKIGNLSLAAGSYSLWMLPQPGDWMLIVNKQANVFHTRYDSEYDLGRVKLEKRALSSPVEELTFYVEKNPDGPGGRIRMTWETTEVFAPFTVVH